MGRTSIIVIPCNKRDEHLLPGLVRNLRNVGIEHDVVVAPCAKSPPTTDLPTISPWKWKSHIVCDVVNGLLSTGADTVFKLDADVWFRSRPDWIDYVEGLQGYCHGGCGAYVAGAFYGIDRETLSLLPFMPSFYTPHAAEDAAISRLTLQAKATIGNRRLLAGYGTPTFETAQVVHLGQGYNRANVIDLQKQQPNYE